MAIDGASSAVESSLNEEESALLGGRIETLPVGLKEWAPDQPLNAVVCTPAAFAGLSPAERHRVIEVLQSATRDGGVHLVDTIIASSGRATRAGQYRSSTTAPPPAASSPAKTRQPDRRPRYNKRFRTPCHIDTGVSTDCVSKCDRTESFPAEGVS
jgi:hypothetical protein